MRRKLYVRSRTLKALALVAMVCGVIVATQIPPTAYAGSTTTIDSATTNQRIDGFGASESFLQADFIMNASHSNQKAILQLLYSPTKGAGLTILRNQIGESSSYGTIEPNPPASPTSTPQYTPLGNDQGQEWLASTIKKKYGVDDFFADAWSAPPFMKTNDSAVDGGTLCGLSGASCASGDWRQAYANYLVQYAKDYAADGLPLKYIGFVNEPNFTATYASMVLTPAQTAEEADVVGPTLAGSGVATHLECCAPTGWDQIPSYASAIESDSSASHYVTLFTGHGYTAPPNTAVPGWSAPAWETEWSTFDTWDPSWDDGTDASGFTWAQNIYNGLTSANLSGFLYWWGADYNSIYGNNNEGLIRDDGTVVASKRLWAFANYSRFIRPGAVRIGASTTASGVELTAFKNTNGTVAIVALNTTMSNAALSFSLSGPGMPQSGPVRSYLTDATHSTAKQKTIKEKSDEFSATIAPRALVTYEIK